MDLSHSRPSGGRLRFIATAIIVLAALAILISLGTWQVERLHWKEGLLADIAERRAAAPVPLAAVEAMQASGADVEYRRVTLTGSFDHTKERHFFATFEGQTGFYVYTPMTLADGRILFVNRGFVPYDLKVPEKRAAGEVAGVQRLTGYVRAPLEGKPSSIVPDNDVPKNIFYWKDLWTMAASTGIDRAKLVPLFVDVDASVQNPAGWPKGGVTQFDLPNSHLQYAVTWYGLAAALVAVVIGAWWRGRKPAAE
ncbi:SURF1 family protein [Neorhizobium lilium]|uniref:SURF1-like protein n=1 Tax=Neorhizobium lilium TaxID=2503024 RepID=A0A3S3SD42_9HYPH|nr:SURF1 family protein [Neorhizobium lilium]RWX77346.1 SURF1 family protein [Neorhizobium lilium]